jgi:hypothetical protein
LVEAEKLSSAERGELWMRAVVRSEFVEGRQEVDPSGEGSEG